MRIAWAAVAASCGVAGGYRGIDPRGHVALVAQSYWNGSGWKLTIRGANQYANSGNTWGEQNCTNVSDWTLATAVPYGSSDVTFWVH